MKQITQDYWTGKLRLEEVPDPAPRPGRVLVQTAFSAISPGTERTKLETAQKSFLGMARSRPEDVQRVLHNIRQEGILTTAQKVVDRLQTPISLGYSSSGCVLQGPGFEPGAPVACIGEGFACHAEMALVPSHFAVAVPSGVSMEEAALGGLGAIALQGVRQLDTALGEKVGVVGLGIIGQMAVQVLRANGCQVFGVDPDLRRVRLALEDGMEGGTAASDLSMAESLVSAFTQGRGLDAVLITAASQDSQPILWSARLSRKRGRIVLLGGVPLQIPRKDFYEKELGLSLSCAFGAGTYDPAYIGGTDYPSDQLPWTAQRNLQAFLQLVAGKKVKPLKFVTHRFPIQEAGRAYQCLQDRQDKPLGILLEYGTPSPPVPVVRGRTPVPSRRPEPGSIRLGVLGLGHFAQTYLLPLLLKTGPVQLVGVVTGRGLTARHMAKKFRFEYCSTDPETILENPDINTVLIATRDHMHASFACRALRSGKRVFVEKPLAISEGELQEVIQTHDQHSGWVMVGFNRRFSSLVRKLYQQLRETQGPFSLHYRVNAGPLPSDHWILHPEEGGSGRLLGEGCHFIDLMQFLVGSPAVSVAAESVGPKGLEQDLHLRVHYQDGSIGTVQYLVRGDTALPRERLEISGSGFSASLENFKKLLWSQGSRVHRTSRWFLDLGHAEEMRSLSWALLHGAPSPLPFPEVCLSTRTTLRAQEALRSGRSVPLGSFQQEERQ